MRRLHIDPKLLESIDRVSEQYEMIHNEIERIWRTQMVFTWHWWLDIALAVLPWIVWCIVRDRKRTHDLLYAGLFTMLAAALLDIVGVSQGGWNYNTWLLPYLPEYFPWDLTVMPVGAMLFYQFFPKVSPWIKGAAFGLVGAYAVEPVFAWLGVYEPTGWEHYYGLPVYFAIYMAGHWLYTRRLRSADPC
ncbi:MAG: hypothetical protein GX647_10355 [Clostridiales bacterium]|nr:hypothetical protein [Clostridiales bacterium]